MTTGAISCGVVASAFSPDPRQAAQLSREAGFAGVQFEAASAGLDLTALSGSGLREFRRILANQEQQLIGLRTDLGAAGFAPGADVDRALSRLDRIMASAAGLASPLVCLDLGRLPPVARPQAPRPKPTALQAGLILLPERAEPAPPAPPPAPPDPAFVSQVASAVDELGRRADRYNVIVAFRSELASFASIHAVLRQVNCPWFGLDLDPVAILHDEWDLDEVFSSLGSFIRHVRGRDALLGDDRRTKPAVVGRGGVPWEQVLANLDDAGYRGWITVDPAELTDRPAAARAGGDYLRSIMR